MMAELLRQGRYADEVMQWLAEQERVEKKGALKKAVGFGKPAPR
jgi:hypothetical protein